MLAEFIISNKSKPVGKGCAFILKSNQTSIVKLLSRYLEKGSSGQRLLALDHLAKSRLNQPLDRC